MIRNRQGAAARFTGKSPPAGRQEARPESIGSATMTQEGTIILDLRAEGPGGLTGDARFVYPRGHAQYHEILAHLGGLRPGESKPVPPWPEQEKK